MTKNPIINALSASVYIILVVSIMNFGTKLANQPDSFMAPVAVISLFTLSAAVMAYLFCYQPLQFYFDNKKKLAVKLFLQTVGVFGCLTIIILILLFCKIL